MLPQSLLPTVAIRDLPLDSTFHPHLVWFCEPKPSTAFLFTTPQIIHRLSIRLLVAQTRLLLNRPSFARALKDNPEDPSQSKCGGNFVALYESAQEIVQLLKQLVIYHPSLIARW